MTDDFETSPNTLTLGQFSVVGADGIRVTHQMIVALDLDRVAICHACGVLPGHPHRCTIVGLFEPEVRP